MGTWGTGITSNDTYEDIYSEFFEQYNNGKEPTEVTKLLIKENQDIILAPEECNNFWFALAKAQWQCKALDQELFEKVKSIIESGLELEQWKKLDATEIDLKKRKIALEKFLLSLQKPKSKPISRKKKTKIDPVFRKGQCFSFKLQNGNYGGAVVLEALIDSKYGYSLIATTRINKKIKPTLDDFKSSDLLIKNYDNWNDKPCISWYYPIRFEKIEHLIWYVDSLQIDKIYSFDESGYGAMADIDIYVINQANEQFEYEIDNPSPKKKVKLKSLIREKRFKLF
jgi:hypothetical protein